MSESEMSESEMSESEMSESESSGHVHLNFVAKEHLYLQIREFRFPVLLILYICVRINVWTSNMQLCRV